MLLSFSLHIAHLLRHIHMPFFTHSDFFPTKAGVRYDGWKIYFGNDSIFTLESQEYKIYILNGCGWMCEDFMVMVAHIMCVYETERGSKFIEKFKCGFGFDLREFFYKIYHHGEKFSI